MRFLYNFPDPPESGDPTPVPVDPSQPADPPAPKPPENKPDPKPTDWEQADRQARFWAKATPEDRQKYMEMIEKQGTPPESEETKALRDKVHALELKDARNEALIEYDLDKDDLDLLTADTPDGIMQQAERLRSRYDKRAEAAGGSDTGKDGERASRKTREYKPADAPKNDMKQNAAALAKDPWMH